MNNYCIRCERCDKIVAVYRNDWSLLTDDDAQLLCLECFARIMDKDYKGNE